MFQIVGLLFVGCGFGMIVGWATGFKMGQESERDRQRTARRIERDYR